MEGEVIKFPPQGYQLDPKRGSAGLKTQLHGAMASVSTLANATGGISHCHFVQSDCK